MPNARDSNNIVWITIKICKACTLLGMHAIMSYISQRSLLNIERTVGLATQNYPRKISSGSLVACRGVKIIMHKKSQHSRLVKRRLDSET